MYELALKNGRAKGFWASPMQDKSQLLLGNVDDGQTKMNFTFRKERIK